MKVLKFGGTSVGTTESLRNVKKIVDSIEGDTIVVVSALGGLTDRLILTAKMASEGNSSFKEEFTGFRQRHFQIIDDLVPLPYKDSVKKSIEELLSHLYEICQGLYLIRDLPEKILDQVVSFGERMSSIIVSHIIEGCTHRDSLQLIKTEKWFNKNIADRRLTEKNIREAFPESGFGKVVMGGFISRDRDSGDITNLGRGGSDYTAALVAAALNADELQIWTDVDGFMTADPRVIPQARLIPEMSFIESMELCSFGAKVIYPPTIYPVFHKGIPIKILNTHNPSSPGTTISDFSGEVPKDIRGVSVVKNTAMLSIVGKLAANVAEINSRSYNAMARKGISVYLVEQPKKDSSFSLAMNENDANSAEKAMLEEFTPELQNGGLDKIVRSDNLSIIAVVKEGIKDMKGLGARLVNTLQRNEIEVKAISDGASDTTLTLVVESEFSNKALSLIHTACFNNPV